MPRVRLRTAVASAVAALAVAAAGACGGSDAASPRVTGREPIDGSTAEAAAPVLPFQADPPGVYVAKVKNILVGLPPTDQEISAVQADPAQLATLIDGWMALPQYAQKMMKFFELAFQQTQISIIDFTDQTSPHQADVNPGSTPLLVQNAKESFARTVLELIAEGRPFTETMSTGRLMMTPALMELYAYLDAWQVDDAGKVTDRFKAASKGLTLTVGAAQGPIPIAQTLDPRSASYMHWYDPDVGTAALGSGCTQDPITYPAAGDVLQSLILGTLATRVGSTGASCGQYSGSVAAPQLTAADFDSWKMVTIRQPASGESPTAFYDLATLRSTSTLVLSVPRVGFFSTPAFFANWQTNTSNQARVTANQMLIVATGAQVDGTDTTAPTTTPGLDAAHASQPACVACHQTLDPTRSILAATYSWNYHDQLDPALAGQKGLFAFQGVVQPVTDVGELGAALAQHPLLAQAWAQKLCYYANSAPCETGDPEFQRVVALFKSSGYSWTTLVRALMSSPLTTNAGPTKTTTDQGEVVAVSRRDHFCAALNVRLGFADACGLDALTRAQAQTTIPEIVSGMPSDGYGRGAVAPVLPNQPTLFYRAGTENVCEAVAALVIDVPQARQLPGVKQWSSAQQDAAIADFVHTVMGLTASDPRAAQAQALLGAHFTAARQSGASATDSLESTFVAACLSPSAVSIGL